MGERNRKIIREICDPEVKSAWIKRWYGLTNVQYEKFKKRWSVEIIKRLI